MNLEYTNKFNINRSKFFNIWKTDKWLLDVADIIFSVQSAIFTRFRKTFWKVFLFCQLFTAYINVSKTFRNRWARNLHVLLTRQTRVVPPHWDPVSCPGSGSLHAFGRWYATSPKSTLLLRVTASTMQIDTRVVPRHCLYQRLL